MQLKIANIFMMSKIDKWINFSMKGNLYVRIIYLIFHSDGMWLKVG